MRAPLLVVLTTLVLGVGGATFWIWFHSAAAPVEAQPRAGPSSDGRAPAPPNEVVMERALAPHAQEAKPAEPAPVVGVDGHEDGVAVLPAPLVDFSAQYAGWTRERLEARLEGLELVVQAEQDRLLEQRFEAGRYRIIEVDSADDSGHAYDVLAMKPPEGEVGRGKLVVNSESDGTAKSQPAVPSGAQLHFATLPRSSYPAFYAQLDERDWLRVHLADKYASDY